MKPFVTILVASYAILFTICAFVCWDLAFLAHTTEGCRLGFVFGGGFFALVGAIGYFETADAK
jgi:hypothetical protein